MIWELGIILCSYINFLSFWNMKVELLKNILKDIRVRNYPQFVIQKLCNTEISPNPISHPSSSVVSTFPHSSFPFIIRAAVSGWAVLTHKCLLGALVTICSVTCAVDLDRTGDTLVANLEPRVLFSSHYEKSQLLGETRVHNEFPL